MSKKVKCIYVYQCDWCPRTFHDAAEFAFILRFPKGRFAERAGRCSPRHFCGEVCFLKWIDRVFKRGDAANETLSQTTLKKLTLTKP